MRFSFGREKAKTNVRAILRHKLHFISHFGVNTKKLTIRLFIPFPKKHKCFSGSHKCFENEQECSFRRYHSGKDMKCSLSKKLIKSAYLFRSFDYAQDDRKNTLNRFRLKVFFLYLAAIFCFSLFFFFLVTMIIIIMIIMRRSMQSPITIYIQQLFGVAFSQTAYSVIELVMVSVSPAR